MSQPADPRWTAVRTRDRSADGRFVFAVTTTGIYCRPGCPARTPAAAHVRFFDTAVAAREAGFRACRRCRPDDDRHPHADAVEAACRRLQAEVPPPPLAALAADAGLSLSRFQQVFRTLTGVTPRAYAAARRAERVRTALVTEDGVADAAFAAGFASSGRFYEATDDLLGMTPSAWRAGGAGETLRVTTAPCSLGHVLVASTDRGLCTIELGDDPDALVSGLTARLPHATLVRDDPDHAAHVAAVVALVEDPARGLDLPLDVRGTAFQQRVWAALRRVPCGTTVSYAELATALGRPSASRAVAGACAANTLAVAIPCHRVVRGDGSVSGYRWGVSRKRALLAREADTDASRGRSEG